MTVYSDRKKKLDMDPNSTHENQFKKSIKISHSNGKNSIQNDQCYLKDIFRI